MGGAFPGDEPPGWGVKSPRVTAGGAAELRGCQAQGRLGGGDRDP